MPNHAIVETTYGPIRGVEENGVFRFLGVPYAKPPVGRLRFKAPQPMTPWNEPLDCLDYGDRCPVVDKWGGMYPYGETEAEHRYHYIKKVDVGNMDLLHEGTYSENCLHLSLWTSGLNDGKKRPVLVWVHGGGFHSGCADAPWHDGTNMAKDKDAVFITVAHRLNIFGYLDLRDYGPEYADSPNAGMLDLVAALRWVHDNITRFGGDPDRVLFYGESGGAGKTSALFAMPEARGLFHSAIAMSAPTPIGHQGSEAAAKRVLDWLGIAPENVSAIAEVPAEKLLEVQEAVRLPGMFSSGALFGPVVDGRHIPYDTIDPRSIEVGPDAVYCMGTTHDDARLMIGDYHECDLTWEELPACLVRQGFDPERIEEVIALCKKDEDRDTTPSDVLFCLRTEISFRGRMRQIADLRSRAGKPVYMYLFSRESPSADYKAGHGSEIPFFTNNMNHAPYNGIDDPKDLSLARVVTDCVVRLASTGDPAGEGCPIWPRYEPEMRLTMDFTKDGPVVRQDPLQGYRLSLEKHYRGRVGIG